MYERSDMKQYIYSLLYQMEDVLYLNPIMLHIRNLETLVSDGGKKRVFIILAYTCQVRKDLINLAKPVRVYVNGKEESEEEQETVC